MGSAVNDIDCEHTPEVVCPWCGYQFECSYELFTADQERDSAPGVECHECGRSFSAYRNMSVSYSTYRDALGGEGGDDE